mgnify:CR=1 FL=1
MPKARSARRERTSGSTATGCVVSEPPIDALAAKVAEVDAFIRGDAARRRVRELDPEVCFWGMNHGKPLGDGRTTRAGVDARLKPLLQRLPQAG